MPSSTKFNILLLPFFIILLPWSLIACTNPLNSEIEEHRPEATNLELNQNTKPINTTTSAEPFIIEKTTEKKDNLSVEFSYPADLTIVEESSKEFTVMEQGQSLFLAQKFTYDDSFGLGAPGLNRELRKSVIQEQTCKVFENKYSEMYLWINFNKPYLCKVITNNNMLIVYAMGVGIAYETLPDLSAMVLILDEKEGIIMGLNPQRLKSQQYQEMVDAFKKQHPAMEFPDEDWKELADMVIKLLENEIENPPVEFKNNWKFLENFSKGIKIKAQ